MEANILCEQTCQYYSSNACKPSYTIPIVSTLICGLGPEQPTVDENLNFFLISSIIDLSSDLESINLDILGETIVLGLAIIPIHSTVIVIRERGSTGLILSARPTATIPAVPTCTSKWKGRWVICIAYKSKRRSDHVRIPSLHQRGIYIFHTQHQTVCKTLGYTATHHPHALLL